MMIPTDDPPEIATTSDHLATSSIQAFFQGEILGDACSEGLMPSPRRVWADQGAKQAL
jgi:hypothetical protein